LAVDLTQEKVISVALQIRLGSRNTWPTSFCHGLGLHPFPSQAF